MKHDRALLSETQQTLLSAFLQRLCLTDTGISYWNKPADPNRKDPTAFIETNRFTLRPVHIGGCKCGTEENLERFAIWHFHSPICEVANEKLFRDASTGEAATSLQCDCGRDAELAKWLTDHPHAAYCPQDKANIEDRGQDIDLFFLSHGRIRSRSNRELTDSTLKTLLDDFENEIGPFRDTGQPEYTIHGLIRHIVRTSDGHQLLTVEDKKRKLTLFLGADQPPLFIDRKSVEIGARVAIATTPGTKNPKIRMLQPI